MGERSVRSATCGASVGDGFGRGHQASQGPARGAREGSPGWEERRRGSGVSRRACWACRGGGNTVVAPRVYFRADVLGSRSTSATVQEVPRDPMHSRSVVVCGRGIIRGHWFRPRLEVTRGNQGSAAVGSAGPDPRWQRWGWSSDRSRPGRAIALGTTVVEAPRRRRPVSRRATEGRLAHPTDRVLGGAAPSRSSPGANGLPVVTSGARARLGWSRGGFLSELASRSIRLPWSPVDSFHPPASRTALVREGRARRGPGASGCSHPGVLGCSAGWQVADLRARKETSRGFDPSRWQHRRGFRAIRSFLQEVLRALTRSAGQTLNARQKGTRGRLRWFNPSRSARGLKTA